MGKFKHIRLIAASVLAVVLTVLPVSAATTNTVKYNAKNEIVGGGYSEPVRDGYKFLGWSTDLTAAEPDTNIKLTPNDLTNAYLNSVNKGETKTFYAVWKVLSVKAKYAVSVYGINHDLQGNGTTYSHTITFGPAQGNYVTTEKAAHVALASETDSNKCIHNHSWSDIIAYAKSDPTVFNSCITNGCTKTIDLAINDTLLGGSDAWKEQVAKYYDNETGDGPGQLFYEIDGSWRIWNPQANYSGASSVEQNYGTNRGGWPASRARAVLNGSEVLTAYAPTSGDSNLTSNAFAYANGALKGYISTVGGTYSDSSAYASNISTNTCRDISEITASNCLLSCFPAELQDAILPKAVENSRDTANTAGSTQTTYDKLWLTSLTEQNNNSGYGGTYYSGRGNSNSYFYRAYSGGSSSDYGRVWLRSPYQSYAGSVYSSYGRSSYDYGAYYGYGLGAGFVIGQ